MWGDFMLLPNHLYKPNQLESHPASSVTAATAIGLSANPILNPSFCAAAAAAAATSNHNNINNNNNNNSNTNHINHNNSTTHHQTSQHHNANGSLNVLSNNCHSNGNLCNANVANNNLFGAPQSQTPSLLPALQAMSSALPLNKLYIPQATPTVAIPQLTLAAAAAVAAAQQQHQTHQPAPQTPTTNSSQENTSNHYHIFVGDIAPEIETNYLREKFSLFGRVTECKIIKDMHTQKPKGYGFVAYATKEEAEDALTKMNGRFIGCRQIRTNWAIRRPPQPPGKDQKPLDYNEVFAASSESNCTIYVGGITNGLSEELLRESFKDFGEILEVRIFKEKGYAFVRFDTHEGATQAIIKMHGRDVGSQPCKCSWGKESNDQKDSTQNTAVNPFPFYVNPIGYPFSLLTQQIPDLTAASNYAMSLNNLQNLNGQDFSGYMMSPVPNTLTNSNLGAINGLLSQFSTARGMNS